MIIDLQNADLSREYVCDSSRFHHFSSNFFGVHFCFMYFLEFGIPAVLCLDSFRAKVKRDSHLKISKDHTFSQTVMSIEIRRWQKY